MYSHANTAFSYPSFGEANVLIEFISKQASKQLLFNNCLLPVILFLFSQNSVYHFGDIAFRFCAVMSCVWTVAAFFIPKTKEVSHPD